MGSAAGPVLAIIYINGIIESNRSKTEMSSLFAKFPLIKLYIDDGFFVIRDVEKNEVTSLINLLIAHERSQVIWEESSITMKTVMELQSETTTFLDMRLSTVQTATGTFKFHSSVYYKELASYSYVHWKSAHPRAVKRAVIRGELSRRIRLSSSPSAWKETSSDLTIKLMRRGYPLKELDEAIGSLDFKRRRLHLNKTCAKILKKRTQSLNPFFTTSGIPNTLVPLVVRYDPRSHRSVKQLRKWMQAQIAERSQLEEWDFRLVIAYFNDKKSTLLSSLKRKTNHCPDTQASTKSRTIMFGQSGSTS